MFTTLSVSTIILADNLRAAIKYLKLKNSGRSSSIAPDPQVTVHQNDTSIYTNDTKIKLNHNADMKNRRRLSNYNGDELDHA